MLWFAEALGALAVIINFVGYRQNDINRYRIISGFALISLSIHFFLIGAMAAGIACGLSFIRNIVALKHRSIMIVWLFVAANIGFFAYEWFWLSHHWYIVIAYTSSIIFTVGTILLNDTVRMRQWFVLAEALGLIYALVVGSIFGSVFNFSNLVSITIKLRQDMVAQKQLSE